MIIEEEKIANSTTTPEALSINDNSTSKKHLLILLSIFIGSFLLTLILVFAIFTIYNYKQSNVITKGIYISGIDVSNLSIEKAKEKISKYYKDNILNNDIKLTHGDYETYINTDEIELSYDINSAVNYAYQIGKNGNIIWDNYSIFNALLNNINIMPTYTLNENNLNKFLNNISTEIPDAVIESSHYIDNNNLIITKGSSGNIVDVEKTKDLIEHEIYYINFIGNSIEIKTTPKEPKEIDLNAIHSEIYKEPKDAYYTTNPYSVYPSENGLDFKISLEEAQNLLASSESECTIPLKTLKPSVTTNMIGVEAFPDLLSSFSMLYILSIPLLSITLDILGFKVSIIFIISSTSS